jgi:UDP-glucuronate 4-epimerase
VLDDLSGSGTAPPIPTGVRFVRADVRDRSALARLFGTEGPGHFDAIVHLAALVGVRESIVHAPAYEEVNVGGTIALLEHVTHARTRFVLASSSSVYGARTTGPFRESDPTAPASPYARTKAEAEAACARHHARFGTPVSCLRFFTVYGPGQRPDMAISRFLRRCREGEPLPLYGDGTSRRDYTFVEDVTDGIVRASDHVRPWSIYNLGSGQPVRLVDLVDAVGRAVGRAPTVRWLPEQPGDVPLTHADLEFATRDLGYRPRTTLAEGLRASVSSSGLLTRRRPPTRIARPSRAISSRRPLDLS